MDNSSLRNTIRKTTRDRSEITINDLPYCYYITLHVTVILLKSINHAPSSNIKPYTIIEIEETPFLSLEQPDLIIIPTLQIVRLRIPDVYMAVLWNLSGQAIILKRNTTIGYAVESDYMKKKNKKQENVGKMTEIPPSIQCFEAVKEVTEISHEKLPPILEKSAFMFHHNFYPKPKIDFNNAEISEETGQESQILHQDYDEIVSSSVIRLTHSEK